MKDKQSGFTLVEIAIVLVIIGLLLGSVLKGQELINNAKAKNLANDFRSYSTAIYAYQDRFRFMPGDDPLALHHVNGKSASGPTSGDTRGNGRIGGNWNSSVEGDESFVIWQHLRLANLLPGSTVTDDPAYLPRNAENGRFGATGRQAPIVPASGAVGAAATPMSGSFYLCSDGLPARLARQIDVALDDGETDTGPVRSMVQAEDAASATGTAVSINAAEEARGRLYTVCAAF